MLVFLALLFIMIVCWSFLALLFITSVCSDIQLEVCQYCQGKCVNMCVYGEGVECVLGVGSMCELWMCKYVWLLGRGEVMCG